VSGTQPLLVCEGLDVSRGNRTVLHDISFTLAAGEVVALLGPNGAGKSTLLDALGGVLEPAAGRIERHGRVAVALQSADLARGSVLSNVTAALGWWGVPRAERRQRASEALGLMGVAHLADRPAAALSGGERRRVHLARSIAVRPDVLMLDEPFAGLDGAVRAALLEQTGSALRTAARASLVVVHDRSEAWALADRLIILLDGQVAAEGSPRALLDAPPTQDVARFLGFDGTVVEADGRRRLTRPQHVVLDPDGPLTARVSQMIPTEDGVRLALTLERGELHCLAALPSPRRGDTVRVRLIGGVSFPPADGDAEHRAEPDRPPADRAEPDRPQADRAEPDRPQADRAQPEPTVGPAAAQRDSP
jgi:ABC-type cobalamin/Fe3+-siderophores transport system ATPase subunit